MSALRDLRPEADRLQAANRSETSDSSCVERIPKKDARPIEIGRASDEDLYFPERKSSPGSHGADSVVTRPIIVRQRQKMPRIAIRHQLSLVSARSRTVYEQPNRVDGWVRFRWMFGAGGIVDRPLACDPTGLRMTTLNRKPDMAILIDRPCRIPRYLPSVIVRISYISSITSMRRGV